MAWFEAKTGPAAYKLPPVEEDEEDRLGALKEFRQQGEAFNKQQRPYMDYDKALDIISGVDQRRPTSLSNVKNNQLKRDIRENVASLSNMKPTWTYVTGDRKADERVHALNKRQQLWYYQTFADMRVREVFQYAGVFGTGYLSPGWKRKHWGYGPGDIELKVLGPRDVLPVQLPPDGNLQEAYLVTLRFETPINMARSAWPRDADKLIPDRDSPTGLMRASNQLLQFLSPALNVGPLTKGREHQNHAWPTVDLFWTYVMDMSINTTGKDVLMGEPGTSWSYTVPWLGKKIPDGTYSINGPNLRSAEAEDCLLYPHRRLIIWSNQGILRDGPSYDIHGMLPCVPFYFDKWAWENMGFSLVRDTASLHQAVTSLMRDIVDASKARLRPLVVYNENLISSNLAKRIDPRVQGIMIPANTDMGKAFEPGFQPNYYDTPQHIPDFMKWMQTQAKQMHGLNDLTAIAKAKQIPNSDTVEKLLEMAGPLVQDMARLCESSMTQVADIWKGLAIQYYSTKDRLLKLGDDGVVEEDIDYESGSMIPSHMPGENPNFPSAYTYQQRCKYAIEGISTHTEPLSAHQITNITRRMTLLLAKKGGLPIDWWTEAKALEIQNFGPEPEGTKNVIERFIAQKHIERELAQEMQAGMQQGQQPGRPNSNQKPPQAAMKDGGTRVINKTS